MKALTVRQPWASLIIAGVKPVENRTWEPPATLPQYRRCRGCSQRWAPGYGVFCGGSSEDGMGHRETPTVADGPFPFTLAIHAGARHDNNEYRGALIHARFNMTGDDEPGNTLAWLHGWWANRDLPYGAVLGTITVSGCHRADACATSWPPHTRQMGPCSPWAVARQYHWTLIDPQPFDEPIPARGRQKLWEWSV